MTMTRGLHSIQSEPKPTDAQRHWLERGAKQPGGKLPLFDEWGQRVHEGMVRSCIAHGWAEPWFTNPLKPDWLNPLKPDWLVCKLTDEGRHAVDRN
jgi:hypothetical protein